LDSLDVRQRLAIHAKRVTVTQKDMGCLRDIWRAIDPETWFPPSNESREKALRKQETLKGLKRIAIEEAKARIDRIQRRDKRPPTGLVNFARQRI